MNSPEPPTSLLRSAKHADRELAEILSTFLRALVLSGQIDRVSFSATGSGDAQRKEEVMNIVGESRVETRLEAIVSEFDTDEQTSFVRIDFALPSGGGDGDYR